MTYTVSSGTLNSTIPYHSVALTANLRYPIANPGQPEKCTAAGSFINILLLLTAHLLTSHLHLEYTGPRLTAMRPADALQHGRRLGTHYVPITGSVVSQVGTVHGGDK